MPEISFLVAFLEVNELDKKDSEIKSLLHKIASLGVNVDVIKTDQKLYDFHYNTLHEKATMYENARRKTK